MLAIVNSPTFSLQNSKTIDSRKFYPAELLCYTVRISLVLATLTWMSVHTAVSYNVH